MCIRDRLKRDYTGSSSDADDQGHGFTGIALQGREGFRLWSKAGWTSEVRHDAAYLELPSGRKLIVVIFTRGCGDDKALLPGIGKRLLKEIDSK